VKTELTVALVEPNAQGTTLSETLFLLISGTWLVDFCWQAAPKSERAIIYPDGSYWLDQSASFPLFKLTGVTYDESTGNVQFKKVSIRDGKPTKEWDIEELVLSADGRSMTGISKRFRHRITYTRIAPQDR